MAFLRQWVLILAVLALGVGTVTAASREDRAYAAAAGAFHDQNWAQAETSLAAFIHKYPDSPHLADAVLLQAQAQFEQGKFSVALSLLAVQKPLAGAQADQFDYWIGEVQSATGDYAGAAETFVALTQNYPLSTIRLRATIEAASALVQDHRWSRAATLLQTPGGVFQTAASQNSADELVIRGWLLLAQAQAGQNDFAGAAATLDSLNNQTLPPDLNWKRMLLLGQVKLGGNDFNGALNAGTNAFTLASRLGRTDWVATSRSVVAEALEKLGRLPEATTAWHANLNDGVPAEAQNQALLKIEALAVAQTNFTDAEAALETFYSHATGAAADLALLAIGELHLKDFAAGSHDSNHLATARARFDQLLANPSGPQAGKAFLGRGWCDWLEDKIPASLTNFQLAVQQLAVNGSAEDLAAARFKTGDAWYRTGEAQARQNDAAAARDSFLSARGNYRAVVDDAATHPAVAATLGDRAIYQILRTDLRLRDADDAKVTLQKLLATFPASELVDNSLLLAGEEFSDFGQTGEARATLQQCQTLFPGSPLLAEVAFAIARTYEREQNWPQALASYDDWLKQYPTNAIRFKVEYARSQANFLAGNETNALALFTGYVAQYSTNELAPQAQWWLADYFFRTASAAGSDNFVAAETNYENIFQNTNAAWRNSRLYYPAQLMAGRAAMARLGFPDACTYFRQLLSDTNCPPDTAIPARFAYGAALMQTPSADTNNPMANFQLATNIFNQVCQLYPTNDPGARAWGEIGNCAAQLGDFAATTNAYLQAITMDGAETETRNQAEVGLGIALEKFAAQATGTNQTALLRMARQHYEAVFYGESSAPFWQKEAGLRALQLLPAADLPSATNLILHLERLFPQLKPSLEKKLAALAPAKN